MYYVQSGNFLNGLNVSWYYVVASILKIRIVGENTKSSKLGVGE